MMDHQYYQSNIYVCNICIKEKDKKIFFIELYRERQFLYKEEHT